MAERRVSPGMPKLLQAVRDALHLPDLRRKILFTIGILVVFRLLAHIPLPGVNTEALHELFQRSQLLGMLDLFSGGAMRNLSIVAMGVYPYITATIVMQLLVPVIPRLQALSQEGEEGRRKLDQYTHWLTVPLAMLQGYGQLVLFSRPVSGLAQPPISGIGLSGANLLPTFAMILCLTAGTMFLVWLGERITEHGIGNGISIIIFGGIVAALPANIGRSYLSTGAGGLIKMLILFLAITFFIVYFTEAYRRIPVQYSRQIFRGGRMYRQSGGTFLPIRVNSAGMIPLIFAMALMIFPGTMASWFANPPGQDPNLANYIQNLFSPDRGYWWFYWGLFFLLVIGFTFFYTMIIFQQQNIPDTLQKQGGFIPGIRPGKTTADYLNRVINRVTWGGAICLGLVAIMPVFARWIAGTPANVPATNLMILSSAGLLIVVGVVLDTMRQMEAQLLIRHYEGFLK